MPIDDAVLDATLRRLARDGFIGLSLASVAGDAGTSRPAIYRRWPDKESLVVDAIARLAQSAPAPDIGEDPFEDLVAELEHFRHCITEAGALPVAGLMLGDDVNEVLRAKYHDLVVVPRRSRIRACLQRGIDDGSLEGDVGRHHRGNLPHRVLVCARARWRHPTRRLGTTHRHPRLAIMRRPTDVMVGTSTIEAEVDDGGTPFDGGAVVASELLPLRMGLDP